MQYWLKKEVSEESLRRAVGPLIVGFAVAAAYVIFAAWQWAQFTVKSWDLAIFTQLLQSYAHLQAPIVTVKGADFNLLGDHFHPLLVLLAPIYALFPHAFTLLVIQALCFAVTAMIIAASAQQWFGAIPGSLLGLVFGFSWGLQAAADAQFHEVALAVPLLTLSLTMLLKKRYLAAALWAAPLVFVKEDLGLTVLVIGILMAYIARRITPLWLSLWGAVWFLIAIFVVLPALNPEGEWAYSGNTNMLTQLADPTQLFALQKGETILLLVVITAGVALRSPYALLMLPTLSWRFLSTESYWGPTWHYSAVLMPIAYAALIDGVERIKNSSKKWQRTWSKHAVAIAVTAGIMLLPGLPLRFITDPQAWNPPPRKAAAKAVIAAIPQGATIASDVGLMSYLVDDHKVYWTGNENPAPDCLLLDFQAGGTPQEWGSAIATAQRLYKDVPYRLKYESDGYELVCR